MTGLTDVRGPLLRRFTTSTVPTLSPIGQQRRQAMGDSGQTVSVHQRKFLIVCEHDRVRRPWI